MFDHFENELSQIFISFLICFSNLWTFRTKAVVYPNLLFFVRFAVFFLLKNEQISFSEFLKKTFVKL